MYVYVVYRVATHSGKSGKLREFLNYRKAQENYGNFVFFLTQGDSGQFFLILGKF